MYHGKIMCSTKMHPAGGTRGARTLFWLEVLPVNPCG
jgi:hypothetical protein